LSLKQNCTEKVICVDIVESHVHWYCPELSPILILGLVSCVLDRAAVLLIGLLHLNAVQYCIPLCASASKNCWVERIKEIPETKIVKHGTPFTDYQIGRFKVIAEFNFKVLEEKNAMSGAPDFGHQLNYPIKSVYKPDCLK
jgi:hypothetical protein